MDADPLSQLALPKTEAELSEGINLPFAQPNVSCLTFEGPL